MKMRAAKGEGALAIEELDGNTGSWRFRADRCLEGATAWAACSIGSWAYSAAIRWPWRSSGISRATRRPTTRRSSSGRRVPRADRRHQRRPLRRAGAAAVRRVHLRASAHHTRCAGADWRATPSATSSRPRRWRSSSPIARSVRHRALSDRLEFTLADLGYHFPSIRCRRRDRDDVPAPHHRGGRARPLPPVSPRRRASRSIASSKLIERLNLAGYFLIVWDIVRHCRQQDILVQGRGRQPTARCATAWASRPSIR